MVYSVEGVSQTITAGTHGYGMGNILEVENEEFQMFKVSEDRIRKKNP